MYICTHKHTSEIFYEIISIDFLFFVDKFILDLKKMRIAFLSLCLFISLSSASLLRKSIARRQADAENCQAIEGFDCKCSYYRVTCTTERELQSTLTIVPQEKEKYSSVELVITGQRDYNIQDSTFLPIKQLYKPDADNVEFRVKFEKFTALNLQSPGIFNRVFPDGLPSNARKYLVIQFYLNMGWPSLMFFCFFSSVAK